MTRIAIFASGAGSNAQQIITYFNHRSGPSEKGPEQAIKTISDQDVMSDLPVSSEEGSPAHLPEKSPGDGRNEFSRSPKAGIAVTLVVCNKPEAGVMDIARKEGIETLLIEKETFFRGGAYVDELKKRKIDFIVLAGFLWKAPDPLLKAFPRSIINIHPALLPKYGGKGMYGSFVHEAVINAKEETSGITIHYIDEQYDHGDIIFQANCRIDEADTPQTLAQKIHALEHEHYPRVIEMEINRQLANLADH